MLKKIELIKPFGCSKSESAVKVAKKLRDSKQRHIYVVENNYPIGIISTTDINNKVVAEGKDPNDITAEQIMSKPIDVYESDKDPVQVYKDMIYKKRLTVAVVEKRKFIGVLTINRIIGYITHGG